MSGLIDSENTAMLAYAKSRFPSERRGVDRRRHSQRTSTERRHANRPDRRRSERVPVELWMEEISGDNLIHRRSCNISEGGVFFENAIPHTIGRIITLRFELPSAQVGEPVTVQARGKVVNTASNSGFGMGVQFLSVDGDGRERIREFLEAASQHVSDSVELT